MMGAGSGPTACSSPKPVETESIVQRCCTAELGALMDIPLAGMSVRMSPSMYSDNALYQLSNVLAAGGRHSTAIALRLLAQAGYTTLEHVDAVSDWVLLSIRGIGVTRLMEVRRLTRNDWQPPSAQSIQAANWFLAAAQFALRYWPPETLASVIRGSTLRVADGAPHDKRLAIDVFSHAVRQALRHCEAEELIQALRQADGGPGECARQVGEAASGPRIAVEQAASKLPSSPAPELSMTPSDEPGAAEDSDHFAHPRHKRLEIVEDYWAARERGLVQNKENWARSHYHISAKTLLNYEREFRD